MHLTDLTPTQLETLKQALSFLSANLEAAEDALDVIISTEALDQLEFMATHLITLGKQLNSQENP